MELKLPSGQFCGDTVKDCELDGLRLVETAYRPGLRLPKHSHEQACFIFVIKGNFGETYGAKSRACDPFTLIYRPADEVHSDHFYNSGAQCLNIEIKPRWAESLRRYSVNLNDSAAFHGGTPGWLALKLYKEFQQPDEVSPLAMEGLLLEIMAEAARHNMKTSAAKAPRWLNQAQEFLNSHFSEGLTVGNIASVVDAHPTHLARLFRRHYGCTIGEYIRRLRIEFACRELSTSDHPLAEIASAAGFYDQGHFSRTFKRLTGMTPAKFREVTRPR